MSMFSWKFFCSAKKVSLSQRYEALKTSMFHGDIADSLGYKWSEIEQILSGDPNDDGHLALSFHLLRAIKQHIGDKPTHQTAENVISPLHQVIQLGLQGFRSLSVLVTVNGENIVVPIQGQITLAVAEFVKRTILALNPDNPFIEAKASGPTKKLSANEIQQLFDRIKAEAIDVAKEQLTDQLPPNASQYTINKAICSQVVKVKAFLNGINQEEFDCDFGEHQNESKPTPVLGGQ